MLNFLRGTVIGGSEVGSRVLLILEVNCMGFEIQIPRSLAEQLNPGQTAFIHTHLLFQNELPVLVGFANVEQRDFFRLLLKVQGVGAQVAIAILDQFDLRELLIAINSGNAKAIQKIKGVGQKTAQQICLQLGDKMRPWYERLNVDRAQLTRIPDAIDTECREMLQAMGYQSTEIDKALASLAPTLAAPGLADNTPADEWIRQSIIFLSSAVGG